MRVRIDRLDLIALNPRPFIEIVNHDLGAEGVEIGAAGRQGAAVVVDHPDLDFLPRFLRCGYCVPSDSAAAITPPANPMRLPKNITTSPNELLLCVIRPLPTSADRLLSSRERRTLGAIASLPGGKARHGDLVLVGINHNRYKDGGMARSIGGTIVQR